MQISVKMVVNSSGLFCTPVARQSGRHNGSWQSSRIWMGAKGMHGPVRPQQPLLEYSWCWLILYEGWIAYFIVMRYSVVVRCVLWHFSRRYSLINDSVYIISASHWAPPESWSKDIKRKYNKIFAIVNFCKKIFHIN